MVASPTRVALSPKDAGPQRASAKAEWIFLRPQRDSITLQARLRKRCSTGISLRPRTGSTSRAAFSASDCRACLSCGLTLAVSPAGEAPCASGEDNSCPSALALTSSLRPLSLFLPLLGMVPQLAGRNRLARVAVGVPRLPWVQFVWISHVALSSPDGGSSHKLMYCASQNWSTMLRSRYSCSPWKMNSGSSLRWILLKCRGGHPT